MNTLFDKKPTILVVEDAHENIDVLYNILKEEYEIKVATDGKKALKLMAGTEVPDLILLDILMPEMDGYTTIKRIKKDPVYKDIPIIFLTSKTEREDIVKGFNLGAVDYVGKPFNAPELLSRIRTQISLKKQKDLLEQRSKEQKELLQIMCHDLATHFSIIKSSIWLSENKNADFNDYKKRIKLATFSGVDIINLVREMRAVEDKKLSLDTYDLNTLIRNAVNLQKENLENKQISIKLNIPENLKVIVESRSFVNSVVNNILSNAIKFSSNNSEINISAKESKNIVSISFKDAGIGIPGALMEHLFKLSKKTTRLGTSGEKGTGYGMPLIKKFIELYGGEMEVKSKDIKKDKKNHGTEVVLHLKSV